MKKLLIFIALLLSFNSYSQALKQEMPEIKKLGAFMKFEYFRVARFKDNTLLAKDFSGDVYINDRWLAVKAESMTEEDHRFDFTKELKPKMVNESLVRSWEAHPYGFDTISVYIEYKEGEYLSIVFPDKAIGFYYLDKSLKDQVTPFPEHNVWYEKLKN